MSSDGALDSAVEDYLGFSPLYTDMIYQICVDVVHDIACNVSRMGDHTQNGAF